MAALDFPHLGLSIGQTHPNPPVSGQPVYTWDGEKWTSGSGLGAIYISDSAPAAPVGSLWWESDTGILYVRYNDGTSTQWVAIAGGAMGGVVRYDGAQALTATEQATARKNIYAAPFDALAYSGMQINGGMEVSQEKGIGGTPVTAGYVCDGWALYNQGAMVVGGRSLPLGGSTGLPNYMECSTTTALASLTASALSIVFQYIEGYRVARLAFGSGAAQSITIAFWTAHFRTGLYCGNVNNSAGTRSYVFTYTQSVSNVWEYHTVTIPGDNAGTWQISNTAGLGLDFVRAAGTDWHTGSPNTWLAGNFKSVAGAVNGVGATSDVFRITGVVVLPGIEAPTIARSALIMRPYDQELLTCQRYWWCSNNITPKGASIGMLSSHAVVSTALVGTWRFTVPMRGNPTITLWNNNIANQVRGSSTGTLYALTGATPPSSSPSGFTIMSFSTATPALTVNVMYDFDLIADARL